MPRYENTVIDEYERAVPSAEVLVKTMAGFNATLLDDDDDALANPVEVEADGSFYFNAAQGAYVLETWISGTRRNVQNIIIGEPQLPDDILEALELSGASQGIGYAAFWPNSPTVMLATMLNAMETTSSQGLTGIPAVDSSVGLQRLINNQIPYGGDSGGGYAVIDRGDHTVTASRTVPNRIGIGGKQPWGSIIYGDGAFPVLINADSAFFAYVTLEKMGIRNGTHAIKTAAGCHWDGVVGNRLEFSGQSTACIEILGFFQCSEFYSLHLYNSAAGIISNSGVNNNVTLYSPQFKALTGRALYLTGCEDFQQIGPRFEQCGGSSDCIVKLAGTKQYAINGGYTEGGSSVALKATSTAGPITYNNHHFTFPSPGTPYTFDVDTPSWLVMNDCEANYPIVLPNGAQANRCKNITVAP